MLIQSHHVPLDKLCLKAKRGRLLTCGFDRRRSKIDAGYRCSPPHQRQGVLPEVTLKMENSQVSYIAKFTPFDRQQAIPTPLQPTERPSVHFAIGMEFSAFIPHRAVQSPGILVSRHSSSIIGRPSFCGRPKNLSNRVSIFVDNTTMKTGQAFTMTLVSCFAAGLTAPSTSHACGGLFCGAPPPTPAPAEPVDQTAERILFEVRPNREVSAHVQITYVGPADEFAWIVPVPSVPVVEESSTTLFDELDTATRMPVTLPPPEACPTPNFDDGGGLSLGCSDDDSVTLNEQASGEPPPDGQSPVTRYDSGVTANYTFDVIGAEQSSDLVAWLQDNGYNVSDNMTPVMDVYIGMKFVALKLRDGRSASDITPVKLTYQSEQPTIPIRMTAVAAQPFMGILVFVRADRHFLPENFDLTKPVLSEISFDENGRTNYFDWVARKADEAEGQLFVLESLTTMNGQKISRFYTRMSPEHMTVDPIFTPAPGLSPYQAHLDFSARPSLWDCGGAIPERIPSACAFNYCGSNSTCTIQNGTPACRCESGKVAQTVAGPDGSLRVACVPAINPFGITPEAGMVGTEFDPCRAVDCGQGSCLTKSGFVACQCDDGTVAQIVSPQQGRPPPVCLVSTPGAPTFGPGAGIESQPAVTVSHRAVRRTSAYAGGVWIMLALALAWRRRHTRG